MSYYITNNPKKIFDILNILFDKVIDRGAAGAIYYV
ncbi:hypothetical protein BSNT_10076 [Bacillus subtilis subsp. natto BEST195]|nr:hypothetical protein BSNT_10076 [Bacillus subtilis subsp. natto BEST195]